MGVLHSFSIKNIFYDKMDLSLFYFHVTISNVMCCGDDLRKTPQNQTRQGSVLKFVKACGFWSSI